LDKATQEEASQFILQPQHTDNFPQGAITNALQSCRKELPCSGDFLTDVLRVQQFASTLQTEKLCIWI